MIKCQIDQKWFEFDSAWESLSVSSLEIFYDKFFIKGKFHSNVPQRIIDEYETVEYLMFFAYNHIELYNEAFNKCMRLLEVVVKLKAKELQINLKFVNGREKNLNLLIKEICSTQNYSSLQVELDWFRKLRNMEMHPGEGSFLGPFLNHTSKLKLFVNIVNFLFIDEQKLNALTNTEFSLKKIIKSFDSSYFTALIDNKKYLIKRIINHKVIYNKYDTSLIFILEPILTDTFEFVSKHVGNPIRVLITNYTVEYNKIIGTNANGSHFELLTDNKKENIIVVNTFENDLRRLEDRNRINYEMHIDHKALLDIIDLTYIHSYD